MMCVSPIYQLAFLFDNPTLLLSAPTCFQEMPDIPETVHVLPQTNQIRGLYTVIRDRDTPRSEFIFFADRIIRLLVEKGLDLLPVEPCTVTTPVGKLYEGVKFKGKICGVSIMRAGESMEQGLRECARSVRIGKILIQRDEETMQPKLFYDKLPEDIADRYVFLLDPMLATGGSALMAIDVLKSKGVPPEQIIFLNLVAAPEGLAKFAAQHPKVTIVTGCIDQGLDENSYITPGLGDFGDRYYCI